MPTISRFYGVEIRMYFKDHDPPHFHAYAGGRHARIRIDQIEVITGSLARKQLAAVLRWAKLHRKELEEDWRRARARETLMPIEPLR